MEAKERNFVTLRNLGGKDDFATHTAYDTLGKAVGALDDLGLCMNWAILTTVENHPLITLLYEGWTYKHSFERYVVLPFNKDEGGFEHRFEELLGKIFEPFVRFDATVHRHLISVKPAKDWAGQDCFFITLVLHFADEKDKEGEIARTIQDVLGRVEDDHNNVAGRVFWLD